MPPDAPMPAADPAAIRGSAASFRLLTARLKHPARPPPPPVPEVPPPAPASVATVLQEPGAAVAALLDIMWGAVGLPPQERSMAGDALLLLLPHLSDRETAMLAERVAAMDQPPPLLVSRLVRDPRAQVGGAMLERSTHVDLGDLLAACRDGDVELLRLAARRRSVPAVLSEHIVRSRDVPSLLALLRNSGAELSFASFLALSQMAGEHAGLQAPLALRSDLPLGVALDLLWRLPPELRRVVIARFLTDSGTLARILSIAQAAGDGPALPDGPPPAAAADVSLAPLFDGRQDEAAQRLAQLAGIGSGTVARVFSDAEGEALVVLLKALGLGRARFDDALDRIRATGLLRDDRPQEELKAVFDALSFTKARVLLTYWDWFTRGTGPYAAVADAGLVEAAVLP